VYGYFFNGRGDFFVVRVGEDSVSGSDRADHKALNSAARGTAVRPPPGGRNRPRCRSSDLVIDIAPAKGDSPSEHMSEVADRQSRRPAG